MTELSERPPRIPRRVAVLYQSATNPGAYHCAEHLRMPAACTEVHLGHSHGIDIVIRRSRQTKQAFQRRSQVEFRPQPGRFSTDDLPVRS